MSPPDSPAAEEGYLATVERLWVWLRQSGFSLSPLDVEAVERWRRDGIALPTVCAALIEAVESFREQWGADEAIPGSIRYFSAAIGEAARKKRAWVESAEPQGDAVGNPGSSSQNSVPESLLRGLQASLDELEVEGRKERRPVVLQAYRVTYRDVRALCRDASEGLATLPEVLYKLELIEAELVRAVGAEPVAFRSLRRGKPG